jgi:hypothetical protein
MRTIEDLLIKIPTTDLHHYTSVESIIGVASSRALWASNAYCLNDSSEVIEAVKLVQRVATELAQESSGDKREVLEQLVKWLDSLKTPQGIYIFSMTERRNDLNQWRSYSRYGKGVSVSFEPASIEKIAEENACRLAKCIYRQNEKSVIARAVIEKTLETYEALRGSAGGGASKQRHHHVFEKLKSNYLTVFATFKNQWFKHEKEWRLISPHVEKFNDDRVDYRVGASMLVPYFFVSLAGRQYLFDYVTLGPTEYNNDSMHVFGAFMSKRKVSKSCFSSGIPYREWR